MQWKKWRCPSTTCFFLQKCHEGKTLSLCSSVKTIRSTAIVTCRAEHQGCSSSSATKSSRWGSWNTCEPREVLRRASKMGTFSHGAWCRTIWGEYTALWKIIVFKSNLRWFIHCEVYNVIFMQCGASLNTPDGLQNNRLETPSVCFAALSLFASQQLRLINLFTQIAEMAERNQNGSWRGWELEAGGIMTTSHYSNFRKVVW